MAKALSSILKKNEAIIALVYCAIYLAITEYFFLPVQVEGWLHSSGVLLWRAPSLPAGVIWSASCFVGYFLIPAAMLKFIFNHKLKDHGLSTENFFKHIKIYLGFYALMVPVIYIASLQPEFARTYPFVPSAKSTMSNFLIWESVYILQFFCLEFFFRGYLLNTLSRYMNQGLAIAVMLVPYTMIHFHKPFLETMGAIIAGSVLGYLSLRYKSWLGGAILHSLVALTIDSMAAHYSGLF